MTRVARLWLLMVLNLLLVAGLAAVGLIAHSIGVLSAGLDYVADAAAIGISIAAIGRARRHTSLGEQSRATSVAAALNSGWLVVLCLLVAVESARRLLTGVPEVQGLAVLVMSGIAAVVMAAGALVLNADLDHASDEPGDRLNMRAVLLDTVADAAAAAGVAVAGAVIWLSGGLYWLDPAVAFAVAVAAGYPALRLVVLASAALRASSPR